MRVVTSNLGAFALVVAGGLPGLAFGDPLFGNPSNQASSVQGASRAPRLNDTGLTYCLDTYAWVQIACAGTGQDGEFGRDVTHPYNANGPAGFSFVKVCNNGREAGQPGCKKNAVQGDGPHDWGCTKDLVTGLMWELRTKDGSIRDADRVFQNFGTNSPADTGGLVAAMNAQALCGATDWRLPTVTELFTPVSFTGAAGGIKSWFPDVAHGFNQFWTSEAVSGNPSMAWYVDWGPSEPGSPENWINSRIDDPVVTAARVVSGSATLTHLEPKDDEVVDTVNHLSWRRCVEGMTWQKPNCVGTPTLMYWSDALAYTKGVAAATGVAWRLPNIKELQSIVVLSVKYSPTIDHALFPQTPGNFYWSSTGLDVFTIYRVSFGSGQASRESGENDSNFAIRLVRDTN